MHLICFKYETLLFKMFEICKYPVTLAPYLTLGHDRPIVNHRPLVLLLFLHTRLTLGIEAVLTGDFPHDIVLKVQPPLFLRISNRLILFNLISCIILVRAALIT